VPYTPSRATPRWTPGQGAGGAWKQSPEDFEVVEIPLVAPTGEGEHQWLRVRKIGLTTLDVVGALSRASGVRPDAVGYSGLKDRLATTTQDFTILGGEPVTALPEGMTILATGRTTRRLRVGQLRGNHFTIHVRGGDATIATERIARLRDTGMPNYYGVQRVGGDAPLEGRAILRGGGPRLRFDQLKFALSAWQSELFNRVLAERGPRRLSGDLVIDRADALGPDDGDPDPSDPDAGTRVDTRGLPTGPMFGPRMRWPEGEARALEEAVLAAERLPPGALERFGKLTQGTRRALWVAVEADVEPTPAGFRLRFMLPAGSYATVLLEEVL
jgi:tRNA pseudouridine13 synthase